MSPLKTPAACWALKNMRERRQTNRDYYNELFDTQADPEARLFVLSKKRAFLHNPSHRWGVF